MPIPIRTCIGCGRKAPRDELARLIRLGDGRIAVDATRSRRGRGASVCRQQRCIRAGSRAGGRPWRATSIRYDADALWRDVTSVR
jgi:hypothetical protein